jgi:hypothetical protein
MFKLDDKHLEAAQKIAASHRTKKRCDSCYDRGWIGINDQNMLVLCTRCIDMDAAMEEWKQYVSQHEELMEHFSELFEEKEVDESPQDFEKPHMHDLKGPKSLGKASYVPGQKRTGRSKKI